jgi:dipeptidase E
MKKLVLYSDQIPPLSSKIDNELKALFSEPNPRIGYIPSSSDPERKYYKERKAFYNQLGMDLDVYFELDKEYKPDLLDSLLACDAIHLSGGNTYYFLHWLRKRKMLDPIHQHVSRGGVLIGVSAGSILMTPDISTSAYYGDVPIEGEIDTSGLNLVDFGFFPHFKNTTIELDKVQNYSKEHHIVAYACQDSGGIIISEDNIKCVGDVFKIDAR